jgi:hypothetical protein
MIRTTSVEGGYLDNSEVNGEIDTAITDLVGSVQSWTPVPNSLTVVGTPTYTGKYYDLGKVRYYTIEIASTTTTESTAGATYFTGLPHATLASPGNCVAANADNSTGYGSGLSIDFGGSELMILTPTWSATARVIVSGFMLLA